MSTYYRHLIESGLLLDQYPNAAVAYSLRKLRSGYNGSAIRVRRASDSAEQDFGFDSFGDLDVNSIENFVGYNLWSYSEELQQSVWTKTRTTVTTDTVVAPDGNTTGDIVFETTASGTHSISRGLTVVNGADYSVSFYIKDEGRRYFQIRVAVNLSTDNATTPIAMLDLTTETVISNNGFFRVSPTITSVGSGWYKIEYGLIANLTTTSIALIIEYSTNGTQTAYTGDITKGMAIWGLQITQSSTIRPYSQTLAIAEGQGTITTWYDQSGNGNNAIQTTGANQAQVVSNGSMIIDTLTNKPTTSWTSDRYTLLSNISTNTKYFLSVVWRRTALINLMPSLGSSSTPLYWLSSGFGNDVRSVMNTSVSHGASTTLLTNNIISLKNSANLAVVYQNSVALPNTGTIAPSAGTINTWGQQSTNIFYSGEYQEMIYWDLDQSNNKNGIEQNTNDYYGIY